MSDFSDYSYLIPPADPDEVFVWLDEQEERIAKKTREALTRIIGESTEAFVNSLTATGDMSWFDSIPMSWAMFVEEVLLEDLQGMFLSGGLTAYIGSPLARVAVTGLADQWISVVNQSAVDYALDASNRMKNVGMNAWNDIKAQVSNAIDKGTSTEDMRRLLQETQNFSRYRAEMVARTEMANAYNNGNWLGQEALGEYGPTHKFWVLRQDSKSRPDHVAVNQVTLPINEPFIVGGEEMMFPHAPGASAEQTINCRCMFLELYPGDVNPETGELIPEGGEGLSAEAQAELAESGEF
jgi:hypothetical protein